MAVPPPFSVLDSDSDPAVSESTVSCRDGDVATETAQTAEWNDAYVTVESYLCALGLRNKLLLSRAINEVLTRAGARVSQDASLCIPSVAMEEVIQLVADWFSRVIGLDLPEDRLGARGRLALLLADLPGENQQYFLLEPPLPEAITAALRDSYLTESPGIERRSMTPQPITLNPIMCSATQWWQGLYRAPIFKRLLTTAVLALFGILLLVFFWR